MFALFAEFTRRTNHIVRRVGEQITLYSEFTRRTNPIVCRVPIIVPGSRLQSGLEPILSRLAFYLALSGD